MTKVKRYKGDGEKVTSVWNDKGDKRYGFVSKDRAVDDNAKTRYGIGIDNMGNPYRGVSDNELVTLLGTLDYGYDGDTVYAGVTPNIYGGSYSNELGKGGWAGIGDTQLRAGSWDIPGRDKDYFASLNFGDDVSIPDFAKSLNTPFGRLDVGSNDGNPNVYASFTPQNYIQALAKLLSRGR